MLSSLQTKIVALLILVVLAAQLATFAVVHVATGRSVSRQLTEDLQLGERVWQRFYTSRSSQLLESTVVLADDFGFKSAVASGDRVTMESALRNQASRIGADAALLLTPEGEWRAGLQGANAPGQRAAIDTLLSQAREDGFALSVVAMDGQLYVIALLPVMAPNQIAWVAIGSRFGDAYASDFRALTGIDASFAQREGDVFRVYASSLPEQARAALATPAAGRIQPDRSVLPLALGGSQYFVLAEPLAAGGADPVLLVLQGSLDEAMAPYSLLKSRILMLSGLAGLIALVVAALVGRGISRPVSRLAEAAQRIQGGDYSQPVEARGRDEISGLANAFGLMQRGIAAREERILHQVNHDTLTGLPNRAFARAKLEQAMEATGAAHGAVLMLDLDRFKEINDTLGHDFGDQVLQEIGKRLQHSVRNVDTVARLGGDEFMVLLEDVDGDSAQQRAQALLERLRLPLDLPTTRVTLDCSIGMALHPDHGRDAQTLLRRADIALYDAKQARSGVAVYREGRDEVHLRQLGLMGDLRQSIAHGELRLKFQPKVDLAHRQVRHVEALLRWDHPVLGAIPPDEFIPLAERSGFVHELTRFVIENALAQNAQWRDHGVDLGVAINLSAMDLMDADFIHECQRRHRVSPEKIILEVTEGALMRDVDYAVRMLHRLRAGGIRLSIDDFGTGYSSLAQLKRMPVDEIKIDKSFVMQMIEGSDDAVIVRSTIELGHNMGLSVIAEGVETDVSLALLKSYRCDMVQGYLFSAPLAPDALVAWCSAFSKQSA